MSKTKNIKFEEAMKSLEDSAARLEGGTLTLDEALAEFEAAIGMLKICETRLEDAKQRVRMLIEGEDGTVTDIAFSGIDSDET